MNTTTLATSIEIAQIWGNKEAQISYLEKMEGKESLNQKQQEFIAGFLNHLAEDIADYELYLLGMDEDVASDDDIRDGYVIMVEKAKSLNIQVSEDFVKHVKEQLMKELMETPLEETELTRRSKQCLSRHGIKTVEELCGMSAEELGKVRNFGILSIEEVTAFVSSIN